VRKCSLSQGTFCAYLFSFWKCKRVFGQFIENKFLNLVPFCVLTVLLRLALLCMLPKQCFELVTFSAVLSLKCNSNAFITCHFLPKNLCRCSLAASPPEASWAEGSCRTMTTLVASPPSALEAFAFYRLQLLCQSFPHISLHQMSHL